MFEALFIYPKSWRAAKPVQRQPIENAMYATT
jgi:hypothetical protein